MHPQLIGSLVETLGHRRSTLAKTALLFLAVVMLLQAAPARAGNVYVPVLDRVGSAGSQHKTEIWVANSGAEERRYALTFLAAGSDGTQRPGESPRAGVLGGRTSRLINLTSAGAFGMAELEAAPQLFIDARLVSTPASGAASSTPVPVISSENALAANTAVNLVGLVRSSAGVLTDLDLVNLAEVNAQCSVVFTRADGTQIAATAVVTLPPLSLRHFADALGVLGESQLSDARAAVTCDQQFYAFATLFDPTAAHVSFVLPAASGASTLGGTDPLPGNPIVFTAPGLLHKAARGNEGRVLKIPVSTNLSLSRMVVEWEVVPGPWNPANTAGHHLLGWLHRGKYSKHTILNVNALGPNRGIVRNNQNIDFDGVTNAAKNLLLVKGVRYKIRVVYDAPNGITTIEVLTGGQSLTTLQHAATAAGGVLTVPSTGLFMLFGHLVAHGPEMPSYGWEYHNLRLEMYPD
jgi:hypothetical protein